MGELSPICFIEELKSFVGGKPAMDIIISPMTDHNFDKPVFPAVGVGRADRINDAVFLVGIADLEVIFAAQGIRENFKGNTCPCEKNKQFVEFDIFHFWDPLPSFCT